jgi:hypothetical protein
VTSAGVPFTVTTAAQVVCTPAAQTIVAGGTASFFAFSGFASFAWSAPGGLPAAGGDSPTFATAYATLGAYTVTVSRDTTATCGVTVYATGIDVFRAIPDVVALGQSTRLSWGGITNTASCSIDHGVGAVPCSSGSVVLAPLATTTYTLTMANAVGRRTVTFTVIVNGPSGSHGSQSFSYTGGLQVFVVPALVRSLTIQAWGAQGGTGALFAGAGGQGGSVTATIPVTAGESLAVFVGGQGGEGGGFPPGALAVSTAARVVVGSPARVAVVAAVAMVPAKAEAAAGRRR